MQVMKSNIKTESVFNACPVMSAEAEIQLRHSRKKKVSLLTRFLFVIVTHSDFSTPLDILYPSKMQGKLVSLCLLSYQQSQLQYSLSYFLHNTHKSYNKKKLSYPGR